MKADSDELRQASARIPGARCADGANACRNPDLQTGVPVAAGEVERFEGEARSPHPLTPVDLQRRIAPVEMKEARPQSAPGTEAGGEAAPELDHDLPPDQDGRKRPRPVDPVGENGEIVSLVEMALQSGESVEQGATGFVHEEDPFSLGEEDPLSRGIARPETRGVAHEEDPLVLASRFEDRLRCDIAHGAVDDQELPGTPAIAADLGEDRR
jgi:hypothetical protein